MLNAVYGAFGSIMALLLWIYLSGCIFIFGACLCAAQSQWRPISDENNLMFSTNRANP
jgi:Ca2+-transporting ATPase